MQPREGYYSHMLPLHNGHRSLPRDGHYSALPDNRLVIWDNINIQRVTYLHNEVIQTHFLVRLYLYVVDNHPVGRAVMRPRPRVM